MERLFENAKPVAQIGKVNIAHAFGLFRCDHLVYRVRYSLVLNAALVMPRVEARCVQ